MTNKRKVALVIGSGAGGATTAALLAEAGIGPGHDVGLILTRSARLLPAMLGALKTGAAYVPLDPRYPEDHLRFVLGDAGIRAYEGALDDVRFLGEAAEASPGFASRVSMLGDESQSTATDGLSSGRNSSMNSGWFNISAASTTKVKRRSSRSPSRRL